MSWSSTVANLVVEMMNCVDQSALVLIEKLLNITVDDFRFFIKNARFIQLYVHFSKTLITLKQSEQT